MLLLLWQSLKLHRVLAIQPGQWNNVHDLPQSVRFVLRDRNQLHELRNKLPSLWQHVLEFDCDSVRVTKTCAECPDGTWSVGLGRSCHRKLVFFDAHLNLCLQRAIRVVPRVLGLRPLAKAANQAITLMVRALVCPVWSSVC